MILIFSSLCCYLRITPSVLSLDKFCWEHDYTYEWSSDRESRLTTNGIQILCRTENVFPLIVPGLTSSSVAASSSTSSPQDVSVSLDPANTRINEERGSSGNCNPKWLQNFTENLEIAEVVVFAEISQNSDPERPTKVLSRKHSIFTHLSKIQNYEVCIRIKITRTPCRRRTGNSVPRVEKFDDLIAADFKVFSERFESRHNHRHSIVIQDWQLRVSNLIRIELNFSGDRKEFLPNYLESSEKRKSFTLTNHWMECDKSCVDLWWNHRTSTSHRSETIEIAERAVRRIKERMSAVLLQIGNKWDCWKSSAQSKRRPLCRIVAIRSGWKLVDWFYGMLLLSAKCPRSPVT